MPGALTRAAEPVGADEFARLMENAGPLSDKIALAVSGGPDSMALAACAKRWGRRDIAALIVDHGLRAEAAAEAALVKTWLEKMGIRAEILRWEHEAVTARLHEKAREARYLLLAGACRRLGAGDLLLAHHRDDQAETILMRFIRGSGVGGLAGMAAQSRRGDIRILRPFLSLPKERLIATCAAEKISFVTDPGNASPHFTRGRLRRIMPLLAEEGLTADNMLRLGARAAEVRDAIDHYAAEFLRTAAQNDIGGSVRLDRAALRAIPRAVGLRAVDLCLRYIYPDDYPPAYEPLSALFDTVLAAEKETARSFYGCIASLSEKQVTILREPAAATETLPLRGGETVLWDRRWLVTANAAAPPALVRALGNAPHEEIDALAPGLRHRIPQGRIRAALPAIWAEGRRYALPSFDEKAAFRLTYRKQTFP